MGKLTCRDCQELLDISNFFKCHIHRNGLTGWCKKCKALSDKEYRLKNSEKGKIQKKEYYSKTYQINKEKINERNKNYYKQNLETRRAKNRLFRANYYAKNRELILEKKKEYCAKNKEKISQYNKIYLENYRISNREKISLKVSNRRAKIKGATGKHSVAEINYLKEIQNYQCLMCGKKEPEITLTFDHIVPISKGGGNGIGNGQMLCKTCNSSKNDKFIDLRGTKLRRAKI